MTGWLMVILGIVGFALLISLFLDFKRLNFYEVLAVDRGGKLALKKPESWLFGYVVIWKIFNLERELRVVNIGIEYSIDIYKDEEIWIDLREGGKVNLTSPKIWIKVNDAEKAINVAIEEGELNFEGLIGSVAATVISGHIRTLNVDEVAGVAKSNAGKEDNLLWNVLEGKDFFKKELKEDNLISKGIKCCGFTFKDLDFSEEIREKRREEFTSILGIKIAQNEAKSEAHKILGSLFHILADMNDVSVEEIKKKVKNDPKLQQELRERYTDFKQRELTDIKDYRFGGDGFQAIKSAFSSFFPAIGSMLEEEPPKKKDPPPPKPSRKSREDDILEDI